MVTPDPDRKTPSQPDATPEQQRSESKPLDLPEGQMEVASEIVNDSPGTDEKPDSGGVLAEPSDVRSQTSTGGDAQATPVAPSEKQVEPHSLMEESTLESSGPT